MANKLSVCIATYNESKNINQCLQAVVNWVDEVVIVDGQSQDETVKIAKTYGKKIRIYIHQNPDNFLKNRGRAMKYATSDWLLILDADEIVTDDLRTEILRQLNQKEKLAFWLPRLNHFLGSPLTKGGQYPDYCLRLVKRQIASQPLKTLHDQVEVKATESQISRLINPLWHFPYPDLDTYWRKWLQYCDYEASDLIRHKIKPNWKLMLKYCLWLPKWWFLKTYFRHKGFVDGLAGFSFALFSALRFVVIYLKFYEKSRS